MIERPTLIERLRIGAHDVEVTVAGAQLIPTAGFGACCSSSSCCCAKSKN
jgi:hypothetical protein